MNLWKKNRNRIGNLIFVVSLLYPFVVYYYREVVNPEYIFIALLFLIVLRLFQKINNILFLLPVLLVSLIFFTKLYFLNEWYSIKLYPLFINIFFLFLFAYSLFVKPSAIEKIVSIKTPEISENISIYLYRLTMIWVLFFIINGSIILYLTIYSSWESWVLYTGVLSYIAMGTLFVCEWIFRKLMFKNEEKHHNPAIK